jgi:preprotein translocase subunit SecA
MVEDINQKITAVLMRAQIPVRQPEQVRQATAERRSDYSKYRTQKADYRSGNDDVMRQDTRERQVTQPIRAEKTVGRNDPCPCGSGKKYKNCCGR